MEKLRNVIRKLSGREPVVFSRRPSQVQSRARSQTTSRGGGHDSFGRSNNNSFGHSVGTGQGSFGQSAQPPVNAGGYDPYNTFADMAAELDVDDTGGHPDTLAYLESLKGEFAAGGDAPGNLTPTAASGMSYLGGGFGDSSGFESGLGQPFGGLDQL